jgi:hypothetical protein
MADGTVRRERRDTSPAGKWNRGQFEMSIRLLRVIGLSARAMAYCQDRARETQRLPHQIVVEMFEEAVVVEEVMAEPAATVASAQG